MTTTHEHLRYLDGWRGLAILLVLVGHFGPITSAINLAPYGVELFFVLSGRLMADLLYVRRTDFWTFFKRRVARIVPALLVFSTVLFLLSAMRAPVIGGAIHLIHYLAGIFFFFNYLSAFGGGVGWTDQLWSLSVEEHCYLLLALVALTVGATAKRGAAVYLLIAAACFAWGVWGQITLHHGGRFYWRTDVRAASVLASAGLFLLLRSRPLPQWKWLQWLAPVAVVASVVPNFSAFPEWTRYTVSTVLLVIAINTLDRAHRWVLATLSWAPLVGVGVISYSLYLWQQPFYALHNAFGSPLMLLCAFTMAYSSYVLVERPARTFLNRRFSQRPARQEAIQYPKVELGSSDAVAGS